MMDFSRQELPTVGAQPRWRSPRLLTPLVLPECTDDPWPDDNPPCPTCHHVHHQPCCTVLVKEAANLLVNPARIASMRRALLQADWNPLQAAAAAAEDFRLKAAAAMIDGQPQREDTMIAWAHHWDLVAQQAAFLLDEQGGLPPPANLHPMTALDFLNSPTTRKKIALTRNPTPAPSLFSGQNS